jgi:hypothetical protein
VDRSFQGKVDLINKNSGFVGHPVDSNECDKSGSSQKINKLKEKVKKVKVKKVKKGK